MKIIVVAGGLCPERDVSLASGSLIAGAVRELGHEARLVDLYTGDEVLDFGGVAEHEPDLEALRREGGGALIGPGVLELCRGADLVFIALHGDIGENGKLQAVFDAYGVCYTGTGYEGSLLAMDKDLAKCMMGRHDILTPEWEIVCRNAPHNLAPPFLPCVVKPCGCGSSVGVTIVRSAAEYSAALELAGRYEGRIMAERLIDGREFSVGVLDGQALPVIEIITDGGFFDYKSKYQAGGALEVCPAQLETGLALKMQDAALKVHGALRLGSYSRIDFMLDARGDAYCLEANTLPGMTPTSLLPQEAAAAGISYSELCDKIIKLADKREGGGL